MDSKFLNDSFPAQCDFLDPNSLSDLATEAQGGVGSDHRSQNGYSSPDRMAARVECPIGSPLNWTESVVSSEIDALMNDDGPSYTSVSNNPLFANSDTSFQLLSLLPSGMDSDFGLLNLPSPYEQDYQLQIDNFIPNHLSMSMADSPRLDPLESFYTDVLLDQQSISPIIYTPNSSNGSSEDENVAATQQQFSEDLWASNYPEFEGIKHSLDYLAQYNYEILQIEAASSTRVESTPEHVEILPESLVVPSAFLGPHPLLLPPEQLMTAFETQQPKIIVSKGKKAYTPEGRKKVCQVRKKGACWQCQIRKIACSTDETCIRCQAMASSPKLAGQICLRQRLMDIYLSHSSIYEMIVKSQERNHWAIKFLPGTAEQVSLRMEPMIDELSTLTLTVTRYERIYPGSGLSGSYTKPVSWHPPAKDRCAILPDSVPDVEQLENLSRPGLCRVHDPFLRHDIHDKVDCLLVLCSERFLQHSLHELVTATLRIVNLRSFLMHSLIYIHDNVAGHASHNSSYADPVVNQHIRAIALAGISKAEKFILSQFNDLRRLLALDYFSMMVAKACLLRLLLVYRNDVLLCERSVKYPVKSRVIFVTRLEKVKFMYRVIATTYGTLCERTSSFAPFEWRHNLQQIESTQNGSDSLLETAIKELDTTCKIFCEQELTLEHDEILNYFNLRSVRGEERKALKQYAQ